MKLIRSVSLLLSISDESWEIAVKIYIPPVVGVNDAKVALAVAPESILGIV
jgi:hypothetical protein